MAKRRKDELTQEDVLTTHAYTKAVEAANAIKSTAKNFGLKPDKAYALAIRALLIAAMRQFLEVRHALGEDRDIVVVDQEIEVMEDLTHDVGAFLTGMLEDRDPDSEYRAEFVRKGD